VDKQRGSVKNFLNTVSTLKNLYQPLLKKAKIT
jgi:hypothetical protein